MASVQKLLKKYMIFVKKCYCLKYFCCWKVLLTSPIRSQLKNFA